MLVAESRKDASKPCGHGISLINKHVHFFPTWSKNERFACTQYIFHILNWPTQYKMMLSKRLPKLKKTRKQKHWVFSISHQEWRKRCRQLQGGESADSLVSQKTSRLKSDHLVLLNTFSVAQVGFKRPHPLRWLGWAMEKRASWWVGKPSRRYWYPKFDGFCWGKSIWKFYEFRDDLGVPLFMEPPYHHATSFQRSSPHVDSAMLGCHRGNEVAAPLLEKYLKGKKGVTVENRRRILRLIENMTMGRRGWGAWRILRCLYGIDMLMLVSKCQEMTDIV